MHAHLFYVIGLLLLIIPAGLLTRRRLQGVSLRELADRPGHRLGWLHVLNLLDLARAWGGFTLLERAVRLLEPGAADAVFSPALVALAAAALAGLGLQQVFHGGDDEDLVAPVAYALGLVFACIPPQVAVIVLPLGLTAALGLRSLGSGFTAAALAAVGLGLLLGLSPLVVATSGLVLAAPVLLAGVLQRRLVLMVRRVREPRAERLRDTPVVRRHS